MKVPVEWLSDYVNHGLTTTELARRLTMAGLKVESIERLGAAWDDVLIGQVMEVAPHPTSNKPLHVARVSVRDRETVVVTGAQNVKQGDKVPVILVGGSVPFGPDDAPLEIVARPMAGITSEGMLASARELGISDEHAGIYVLPADSPVGEPLTSILGGDVLDIETVSNRPDTLSMVGIAREVAAIVGKPLRLPDTSAFPATVRWGEDESVPVDVQDSELCPRFTAVRIDGVDAASSPFWLAERLRAAGQRPINLLVDLTNYVMLELGQPMHAFDAARLESGCISVRRARTDEPLQTLDGVRRILQEGTGVVCDGDRPTAVAGVIGGQESEIGDTTKSLLLEAANWEPTSIRRTAQALGVRTEASSRFEKGQPPEQTMFAIHRFVKLLAEITGKEIQVAKITDVWPTPPMPLTVEMPMRDLHRLSGVSISPEQAMESLANLEFMPSLRDDTVNVSVPYWRRVDIKESADLVEEVVRMIGFDALPLTLPRRTMPPPPLPIETYWHNLVRDCLLACGATEVTTHSLTSTPAMKRLFAPDSVVNDRDSRVEWSTIVPNPAGVLSHNATLDPVRLQNYATADRQLLRLTLLPSLLDVIARNLKHTDEVVWLFEIDRVFFNRTNDLPYERATLGLSLSGTRSPRSWASNSPGPTTFYDVKGMVEAVMRSLGITDFHVEPVNHPALHPGRAAVLLVGNQQVGHLGELHPLVAAEFDAAEWPTQVAEIDLDTLYSYATDDRRFRELPRYPAALRDLAAVVDVSAPVDDLMRVIQEESGPLLESSRVFDVYQGEPLPPGKKSVAVEMVFRASEVTLTQDQVSAVMARIMAALAAKLDATFRE